jgi:hypothetical protein
MGNAKLPFPQQGSRILRSGRIHNSGGIWSIISPTSSMGVDSSFLVENVVLSLFNTVL